MRYYRSEHVPASILCCEKNQSGPSAFSVSFVQGNNLGNSPDNESSNTAIDILFWHKSAVHETKRPQLTRGNFRVLLVKRFSKLACSFSFYFRLFGANPCFLCVSLVYI